MKPNYIKIYKDLISSKFPEKVELLRFLENKEQMSSIDVITLNRLLFGEEYKQDKNNNKHKAYDTETIIHVLEHQKEYGLSNSEIAMLYNISMNTITKWKKIHK